ncbi:eukaryotic translation initiation factor 2 alpha kinase [Reticulomyxa filosa]|uniref:non-specific serine/threonine protein kinase n=1 Tax=Reticulomyxa filosa TaxID=46433 RepID=X6LE09_RETFI|nr:eukaryotic translation initiation factor 2 alpha kinase [Reticulomyxa filosa]|eukprot:ETO00243.1 eukaryotic translation initiation factor 2 alpha kinase [Reticulomyxa filosa]
MAKMSSHPNVVRYFTAWTEEMTDELSELIKEIQTQKQQNHSSADTEENHHEKVEFVPTNPWSSLSIGSIDKGSSPTKSELMYTPLSKSLVRNFISGFEDEPVLESRKTEVHFASHAIVEHDQLEPVKFFSKEHSLSFLHAQSERDHDYEDEREKREGTCDLKSEHDKKAIVSDPVAQATPTHSLVHVAQASATNLFSEMKNTFYELYQRRLRRSTADLLTKANADEGHLSDDEREQLAAIKNNAIKHHSHVLIIQMEMCEQGTLKEWLCQRTEVDVLQSWKILHQIVKGLHHIHVCHVLHRDVKPDNVFMCTNNTVKLGDFGLSVHPPSEKISSGYHWSEDVGSNAVGNTQCQFNLYVLCCSTSLHLTAGLGTPTYAAPEQIKGLRDSRRKGSTREYNSYSKPADVYPLGLIAYELFCNFTTTMERLIAFEKLKTTGDPDEQFQAKYPKKLSLLINKMISQDPSQRPLTDEILQSLEDLYGELCQSVHFSNDLDKPCVFNPSHNSILTCPLPHCTHGVFTSENVSHEIVNNGQAHASHYELETNSLIVAATHPERSVHCCNQFGETQLSPKSTQCSCGNDESIVKMKNLQIDLLKDRIFKLESLLCEITGRPDGTVDVTTQS